MPPGRVAEEGGNACYDANMGPPGPTKGFEPSARRVRGDEPWVPCGVRDFALAGAHGVFPALLRCGREQDAAARQGTGRVGAVAYTRLPDRRRLFGLN
jgi:hypothetical protein